MRKAALVMFLTVVACPTVTSAQENEFGIRARPYERGQQSGAVVDAYSLQPRLCADWPDSHLGGVKTSGLCWARPHDSSQ